MRGLLYAARIVGYSRPQLPPAPADAIAFGAGDANPAVLPDLTAEAREALTTYRAETLQYAPREGLPELRAWVVEHAAADGVDLRPEQVLVVNGAKHGLDLACKLFIDPGDAIVVTSPTYMAALGIFRGYQAELIDVPQDGEGLSVAELEIRLRERKRSGLAPPKLLYDVPEFHNPTGLTTTSRRRLELMELAERHDLIIVEDDPYRRIRFEGAGVPPIQSFDRSGRVIGLGTFAKIVAPGLRVGWVTASAEIVRKMAVVKSDGGSCPLTQRMILAYVRAGKLEPHVQDVTRIYAGHRDLMLELVARHLPGATTSRPEGGYYLWVRLPEQVDSDRLLAAALRRGVKFLPASQFYAGRGPANYVRLAYSYASRESIGEGMRRLGAAFTEVLEEMPSHGN